jgi:UrcA family protein
MKTNMICLAFALASFAAPALAGESDAALEAVRVSYRDLDLTKAHDSAVMMDRLREAALQACGASRASLMEFRWATRRSACYKESLARAVADLHAPLLGQSDQSLTVRPGEG